MQKTIYKDQFDTDALVNMVEELVFEELYHLAHLDEPGVCTCNLCILDMAAVLLNAVPPLYSSSPVDRMHPSPEFVEAFSKRREEVRAALPDAMAKVTKRSHH